MEYLLSKDFSINKLDSEGNSPLFYAIKHNCYEIVDLLRQNNARLIISSKSALVKFLHSIIYNNDLKKLKILKNYPIDIAQADYSLKNIGHLAAKANNADILLYLAKSTTFDFE